LRPGKTFFLFPFSLFSFLFIHSIWQVWTSVVLRKTSDTSDG
jgi:hypothetical protein